MKPVLLIKEFYSNKAAHRVIFLFGYKIYERQWPTDEPEKPQRPIGFVQFPIDAPSVVPSVWEETEESEDA